MDWMVRLANRHVDLPGSGPNSHPQVISRNLTDKRAESDPERKGRFAREAKTASALNHPNIITIYDIDQTDGADFIAMEFVPGKALDQLIPRKGLRLNEALKYATQVADALAAAHAAKSLRKAP
jgi:serine/threonine protein kinase